MKNYKMIIQYDGTRYSGWQVQKTTEDTIQGKIERILGQMTGHTVEIHGSGRTDAGVHAKGQVASVAIDDAFSGEEIRDYLNTYLPRDIAVLSVEQVDERFHARFSATGKTYLYRIHTGLASDVFDRKFVYDYLIPLDVTRMREAAALLTGRHDFRSFCGNKHMKKSTVRTVSEIRIQELPSELRIYYTGEGFLMNMVRILTGTLIEVGDGRREPESMTEILAACDRDAAGFTAPPQGLCLEEVYYEK